MLQRKVIEGSGGFLGHLSPSDDTIMLDQSLDSWESQWIEWWEKDMLLLRTNAIRDTFKVCNAILMRTRCERCSCMKYEPHISQTTWTLVKLKRTIDDTPGCVRFRLPGPPGNRLSVCIRRIFYTYRRIRATQIWLYNYNHQGGNACTCIMSKEYHSNVLENYVLANW